MFHWRHQSVCLQSRALLTRHKSGGTWLWKKGFPGTVKAEENTCVAQWRMQAVHVLQPVSWTSPVSPCVWLSACGMAWWQRLSHSGQSMHFVIAPFVLFTCGFRPLDEVSQTTYPELQTLIPPSASAVDHWSHQGANELSYGFRRGPVLIFHPLQACWLCRCICLG